MIPKPPFKVWLGDRSKEERLTILGMLIAEFPNYTIENEYKAALEDVHSAYVNSAGTKRIYVYPQKFKDAPHSSERLWHDTDYYYAEIWEPPRKSTRIIDFNTVA